MNTSKKEQRIIYLLSKRREELLSSDDEKELSDWITASQDRESLFKELLDAQYIDDSLTFFSLFTADKSLPSIKQKMVNYTRKRYWLRYAGVAAAICLLSLAAYFYNAHLSMSNTIQPGASHATLALANGAQINLDKIVLGQTKELQGLRISKDRKGSLTCQYLASNDNPTNQAAAFHTITTPAGGEYRIVLPDSSTVWLNAQSSLRFPTHFNRSERRVEFSGEGFFEISKQVKAPFKVSIKNHQDILVLGTAFNISAYAEENSIRTTLFEGAVSIQTSTQQQLLKPGQEAQVFRESDKLKIQDADLYEARAWREGYFVFKNEPIVDIMRKISRWYNIEVVYQGNVEKLIFGGVFSRSKPINKLLNSFSSTGTIRYTIKGRRVTIIAE